MDYVDWFTDRGDSRHSNIALTHANYALWYGWGGTQALHRLQTLRKLPPSVRNGQDLFPPTIIYDHDDNNDFVHPFNSTFCAMGTRGFPDGRLLEPGEGLVIEMEKRNMEIVDQKTHYDGVTFDIERNLFDMKVRHEIMRTAHGVTAASPVLAKYFKDVVGCKETHFFPNTVIPADYSNFEAVRHDKSIRILWQGGQSHLLDWWPLRNALKTICQKYPNIKIVLFGEYFDWIHDIIPDAQIEHHTWRPYDAYKMMRTLLNIDINLCPLYDCLFNACKSAIKWYESVLARTGPEATLAANVGPYKEIQDGVTGMLYSTPEEFVQKLSLLIEDAPLRARLGQEAKRWVLDNRTPEATIPGLYDFYSECRARQLKELGKPIISKPSLADLKRLGTPIPR
jgi:glycosyltransferase involved in cell wall biosynthesis